MPLPLALACACALDTLARLTLSHLVTLALYHNNTQIPALRTLPADPLTYVYPTIPPNRVILW